MKEQDKLWAEETARKIIKKVHASASRNRHGIPYTAKDGKFDDMTEENIFWWTNGFWGGLMWQMYHAEKEPMYREIAQETEEKLDAVLMNYEAMDHDSGFRWLLTSGASYKLTGNAASRNRMLLAAANLAGRFNPAGNYIRAWNDENGKNRADLAIIDCMMNLPLFYCASAELGDPRFAQIAKAHADMAIQYFLRPDGSVNHIVSIDPDTGEMRESLGGQGYAQGSSWTRGQAWAVYGFALSYIHTGNMKYLDAAKRAAHYFIANIPENGLIPVDFRQPAECALEDSSAAAIAACGLIEIAKYVQEREKNLYQDAALKLLRALDENRCCWDDQRDELLEKCTAAFHDEEHEFPIIYGDYYFVEAVWKLTGREIFMW